MICEKVDRQASMDQNLAQKVVDLLPRFLLNVHKLSFLIYFLDASSSKLFIILVHCKQYTLHSILSTLDTSPEYYYYVIFKENIIISYKKLLYLEF